MTPIRNPAVQMVAGILLVVFGAFIGILICRNDCLHFDGALSVGNVLQSGITIASAWVIAIHLQKMAGDHRKQKELFLGQMEEMLELLKELDGMKASETGVLAKVISTLKKLRMKNDLVQSSMKEVGIDAETMKLSDHSDEIKLLRTLFTTTPKNKTLEDFAETANCPTYVKNDIIRWSLETVNDIDAAIASCKESVFRAQLRVNRS